MTTRAQTEDIIQTGNSHQLVLRDTTLTGENQLSEVFQEVFEQGVAYG